MALFEHYLYVLECGDGSFYTGYTTDVASRVAAHQAGTGAKYTRSHAPVRLIAQARFFSKSRAMSAETHFKKLDRAQKEALLAAAEERPFEDILRNEMPGFKEDTASEFVCRSLAQNIDREYREFQSKLIPNLDPRTIVGVRTPILRRIAKELSKRPDSDEFIGSLPHCLFDENQIHSFMIGLERDYDVALPRYESFLPYIDNWATCDQLSVKVLGKDPERTLCKVHEWIRSDHCYTIRFAIGVLMQLFLEGSFEESFLSLVSETHMPEQPTSSTYEDDSYYVNMMRAWYFAEALTKQESATLPYLERKGESAFLDEWTRRKAIQKAIESRRISKDLKDHLRSLR